MDPHDQFCHNPDCSDRGQSGLGNIGIHSQEEQRYCCSTCGRTCGHDGDALLQAAHGNRCGDCGVDFALPRVSASSYRGGFRFR